MPLFFPTIPCRSNSIRFKKKITHSALRGSGSQSLKLAFKDLGKRYPKGSIIFQFKINSSILQNKVNKKGLPEQIPKL